MNNEDRLNFIRSLKALALTGRRYEVRVNGWTSFELWDTYLLQPVPTDAENIFEYRLHAARLNDAEAAAQRVYDLRSTGIIQHPTKLGGYTYPMNVKEIMDYYSRPIAMIVIITIMLLVLFLTI